MNQVLVFQLGTTMYGLEVTQVQEIFESPQLFYIPQAPRYFAGAMNFHGQVLPVLDLVSFLHFHGEKRDERIIVLPSQLCAMALQVSEVHRIVAFDPDVLLPPLESRERPSLIRFRLQRPEGTVNLLDTDRLIASLNDPNPGGAPKNG